MKKIIFLLSFVLLSTSVIFYGCKKDEETKSDLPDISVWDISQETDWDYWVVGSKNNDNFFIKEENSKPKYVYFYSAEANEHYLVIFDGNGLPDKVVVNDYIFSFKNLV